MTPLEKQVEEIFSLEFLQPSMILDQEGVLFRWNPEFLKDTTQSILQLIEARELEARKEQEGSTIELPDLPFFQIQAFDAGKDKNWRSPIYDTINLPATLRPANQSKQQDKEQPNADQ